MSRQDETYRMIKYGGHPPTCTCVDCVQRRKKRIKSRGGGKTISIVVVIVIIIVALFIFIAMRTGILS